MPPRPTTSAASNQTMRNYPLSKCPHETGRENTEQFTVSVLMLEIALIICLELYIFSGFETMQNNPALHIQR